MANAPKRALICSYQVGFGDCFLLQFDYGQSKRHALIDFGTTGLPEGLTRTRMVEIAKDIRERCGGKLDVVVATHRHADHISGFATNAEGTGSGDIIASLAPDLVIQPWTEDPKLKKDATGPARVAADLKHDHLHGFVQSLTNMHAIAGDVVQYVNSPLGMALDPALRGQLAFIGEDNLANLSAVKNLIAMGQAGKAAWVYHGCKLDLSKVLPGVTAKVLGPPTLKQTDTIRKQRSSDPDEFWMLTALNAGDETESTGRGAGPFPPDQVVPPGKVPINTRWLSQKLKTLRGDQMLQLVRILDGQMNNTSVILLFKAGGKKFLFPGDAQIENWEYALSQPAILRDLIDVDLYKVGHHGSRNATPKTLWYNFGKRDGKKTTERLTSMNSTMPGKHGSPDKHSEVPRQTLVKELKSESQYFTTEDLGTDSLCWEIEFDPL